MKTRATKKRISILVPAFNEEENVDRAYQSIVDVFGNLPDYEYEIVFTDNHSTDKTFQLLQKIAILDKAVKVIRFSRNYGYERSVLVAYQNATGDCSIQIDCDLQDHPRHIPSMLQLWEDGHEVVYGVRKSLSDGPIVVFLRRSFYWVMQSMSEDDLPLNAGEFRLVDSRILRELQSIDDTSPYVRGLISSMGFSQVGFPYDREARIAGTSKFPFKAMVSLAVDGILNHSLVPLRLASTMSLIFGTLTFLMIFVYVISSFVFGQDWPAGFTTTTVLLLVSITLNAMFLGIVGEYLGRMFMQSKHRPVPIIQSRLNFEKATTKRRTTVKKRSARK